MTKICPCTSGRPYSECCEPFHLGARLPTALELMRSRFSAYALGLIDYIVETTHVESPSKKLESSDWKKRIQHFSDVTEFDQLDILSNTQGEDEAYVTFTAHLKQMGKDTSFTEESRFVKVNGRWQYISGKMKGDG